MLITVVSSIITAIYAGLMARPVSGMLITVVSSIITAIYASLMAGVVSGMLITVVSSIMSAIYSGFMATTFFIINYVDILSNLDYVGRIN